MYRKIWERQALAATGGPTPGYTSRDVAQSLPGQCQVRVLPPVPTEGLTPDDVPVLADTVRHSMLTVFREISADGRGGGDSLQKPGGVGEARL